MDKYAAIRALAAIERSDVVVSVIDAEEGIQQQDKHVAGFAYEANKAMVIVVNKWDLVKKSETAMVEFSKKIRDEFKFLDFASIVFLSAKTYCNPIRYHFINRYKLHKFKKELKRDYKDYKKDCKRKKIPLDDDLKKSYKAIKFYIWFCPDANFNILELLKNNITKTDSKYKNYQSACYDYLHELASLKYGDPEKMGFDIVLATLDGLSGSNHRYISDIIVRSNNTVNDYIKAHRVSSNPSQPINNSHTTPSYIPRQNSIGSIAVQPVSRSNIYRDR